MYLINFYFIFICNYAAEIEIEIVCEEGFLIILSAFGNIDFEGADIR